MNRQQIRQVILDWYPLLGTIGHIGIWADGHSSVQLTMPADFEYTSTNNGLKKYFFKYSCDIVQNDDPFEIKPKAIYREPTVIVEGHLYQGDVSNLIIWMAREYRKGPAGFKYDPTGTGAVTEFIEHNKKQLTQ